MTGTRVYHPFLLGLYPPLALYAHGINNLFFETTLSGFAISIGFSVAVFGVLWLIFRDAGKAGIVATALIVFAFFYGHLNNFLAAAFFADQLTVAGQLPRIVQSWSLRIWGIGFGVFVIWLCWRKADYTNWTKILNVVSAALLFVPAITIAMHLGTAPGQGETAESGPAAATGGTTLKPRGKPRDVYYLIFDRYGSRRALQDLYGFDNGAFLKALSDRGFYVAEESNGNYFGSHQSLASSLNMTYLDRLTREMGKNSGDFNPLSRMVQDNEVQRLLRGAGYKYFHLGSTWEVTRLNKHADVNFSGKAPNEFLSVLMQTNAIPIIARKWDIQIKWIESKCFRVNAKLEMLKQIATRKETTYTFAHILLPHEPFVFDADGRCLSEKEAVKRTWKANFLAQLRFTNDMILEIADELIQGSEVEPIIIIQADEGPYPARLVEAYLNRRPFNMAEEGTDEEWFQKMGILNALYLPGVEAKGLHPRISPVNSFRIIFNEYFGASYDILPDRSFTYRDLDHAYDFKDVTDKIR